MTATMGWRERLSSGTEALPDLALDERHTALLIVDMQNYSANPDSSRGALLRRRLPEQANAYFARVRDTVVPNQQKLLRFWREHGLRVIYLTAGALLPDGSDLSERRRRRDSARLAASGLNEHMHPGTFDYQILDALQSGMDELIIRKNSIGAFNSSQIDQILRNMRITGLVIVGVITEGCVETTARDAADRGYDCILVEDGCASDMGDETHEASLLSFARMFGEVRTTADVLARFSAKLEVCP